MFTVVVQKGWKLMVEGNEHKANANREQKNKQQQQQKPKKHISILSAKTVSTGGRRNCCHVYKITNTYEGLRSSHRHLKKHGLFSGALKIQEFEGKGTGPCSAVTVETWGRT